MNSKHVAVAMSGGVDSAVTARLMMKEGHQVTGVTMRVHDDETEIHDAARVCASLGIPHRILDLREAFDAKVIRPFAQAYFDGQTPNPCILCNKAIKFGRFMDWALSLGADLFATGHYVRIEASGHAYHVLRSPCSRKDQSYLFHFMDQQRLSRLLTPLGTFESKSQVRDLARQWALPVFEKKDSDGLCFTGGQRYDAYLAARFPDRVISGTYVDKTGKVIGACKRILNHTIGQKRGLELPQPHPYRVIGIDPERHEVILGSEEDLYCRSVILTEVSFIHGNSLSLSNRFEVQMFHWGLRLPAALHKQGSAYRLVFDQPVRAVAPGQYAVFYRGDEVMGGGLMVHPEN